MPLQLIPTLEDLNIEQVERHLEGVRTRRLSVAITYQQNKNLKLAKENSKLQQRLSRQVDLLGKEILKLDALLLKCKARCQLITLLKNEGDFVGHMMELENEAS